MIGKNKKAIRILTCLQVKSSVANDHIDGAFAVGDWANDLMK
jgi:hypothetical protein